MKSIEFQIVDDLPELGAFALPEEATNLLEALREEIEAIVHGKGHAGGPVRAGQHRKAG